MKSLLSAILSELPEDQQAIAEVIDLNKTDEEILSDLMIKEIVSFEPKTDDND